LDAGQAFPGVSSEPGWSPDFATLSAALSDARTRHGRAVVNYEAGEGTARRCVRLTIDSPAGAPGAVVRFEDVTDRVLLQRMLRRQSEVIRTIDESLPVVIFERTAAGDDWDYRLNNDRFVELFGVPPGELWETTGAWAMLLHPDDRERVLFSYRSAIAEGGGDWRSEFRASTRRGEYAWFRAAVKIDVRDGQELRSVGVLQDITEEKAGWDRVETVRDYDELTGIRTRAYFDRALAFAFEGWKHTGRLFAAIKVDIDDFRDLNVTYGTDVADAFLKTFARVLAGLIPRSHDVSRVGGDKFAFLVDVGSAEQALAIAQDVVQRLSNTYHVLDSTVRVRVSAGVSLPTSPQLSAIELIRRASVARRLAYESGGACALLYVDDMDEGATSRLIVKRELRQAIENQEFVLYYQPKVDLSSEAVVGCEALIRWNHPSRGLLAPGAFLDVAEDTGMIVPLGNWVAREACAQSVRWRNAGFHAVPIAINVSTIQLARVNIFDVLAAALEEAGADPAMLSIEVTESAFINFSEELVETLRQTTAHGITIALDDFGTGYSSLGYIKQLPLAAIKIDQTFVRGALVNPSDAAIARWIAQLGRELQLEVIAEGIETEAELEFVRKIGCTHGQGYYFSRPVPADDFARHLQQDDRARTADADRVTAGISPVRRRDG
jgi:diguanylate cyclase (GGDEF)-like protein/PAS domain S-box-containing protein